MSIEIPNAYPVLMIEDRHDVQAATSNAPGII